MKENLIGVDRSTYQGCRTGIILIKNIFNLNIIFNLNCFQLFYWEFKTLKYWCLNNSDWLSRVSSPPQIQLESRRTVGVLTRRRVTYKEVVSAKVASNSTSYILNTQTGVYLFSWSRLHISHCSLTGAT